MKTFQLLVTLVLLFSACQHEPQKTKTEESIDNTLEITQIDSIPIELDPNVLISDDSLYRIRIYKEAIKMEYGIVPLVTDTFQYTCVELCKSDSSYISLELPSYKTRSPAQPEFYLTITLQDSIHHALSNWHLSQGTGKSLKFYFSFDAFENFSDSTKIFIGYPGWNFIPLEENPNIHFNSDKFKAIISTLESPNSNATIANNKWFKAHRLEIGTSQLIRVPKQ